MQTIKVKLRGQMLLNDSLLNKGMAFSNEERESFGLHGLLPFHVATIEEQLARRYDNFQKQPNDLAKYLFLSSLQNNNEVLFYRLISEHVEEMLPLIYTPTVGDASLSFSAIYTQRRGLFLSYPHRHKIREMVANLAKEEVDIIVATDGERILGLGDLGANGMAIPVGKVALYSLFGGIYPGKALPLLLDVGTNNETLLKDPLYLGWRHPRITGKEYDDFIDLFVKTIKEYYPHVLLQWEDFGRDHAWPLLERYRNQIASFNDDIQGTAAVVLSAILSAVKAKGERLADQRIAVLGAGSAGLGISRMLLAEMKEEGIDEREALRAFYLIDRDGLIHEGLSTAFPEQKTFARSLQELKEWNLVSNQPISLLNVIEKRDPTILIGVSAQPGAFTEEMIRTLAKKVERPIIFPLSNPTTKAEAKPEQLIQWTEGRAMIATGSPFPPVVYQGKTYLISQCNNVYIFPGLGLGVILSKASQVTERMFLKAANILKEHSPILRDPLAPLFPTWDALPAISRKIAVEVAMIAQEEGVALPSISKEELIKKVNEAYWEPQYSPYTSV